MPGQGPPEIGCTTSTSIDVPSATGTLARFSWVSITSPDKEVCAERVTSTCFDVDRERAISYRLQATCQASRPWPKVTFGPRYRESRGPRNARRHVLQWYSGAQGDCGDGRALRSRDRSGR